VRLRAALERRPLFTAVQEIVRVTQLRERLRSLPSSEFGDVIEELEKLLSAAAAAETRKGSLSDFAQALQRKFHATRETHPSTADAIQLITAHKAKGSEWDAVIVPFLAREVRLGAPAYPRIINGDQPQISFDRTDLIDVEKMLERTQRQQMERLLYVALTRARHTLVLALDSEFFRGAKGQVHTDTQLKCLQADNGEANAEVVFAIASEANACGKTASRQEEMRAQEVHDSLGALQLETGWIDLARQKAAVFIETMSPSKFSPEEEIAPTESADVWVEVEPELRPPRIDSPATRYGVWWHEFVQQIPWLDDAAAWDKAFAGTHADSPDMARSAREWRLLRERISNVSEFPSHFANGAPVVNAEMPFFWRMDENRSLEGIVDLAFFDPGEKKWFILDWKTNRVTRDRIDILRVHYRPQIAAYWKAVTEMTGALTKAGIYFTSTGEFVVYSHDELLAEWERLRNLQKPDFAEHTGRVSV
jgi:ATP-dependent exoDNAse (exonuclease V) beta subunit